MWSCGKVRGRAELHVVNRLTRDLGKVVRGEAAYALPDGIHVLAEGAHPRALGEVQLKVMGARKGLDTWNLRHTESVVAVGSRDLDS